MNRTFACLLAILCFSAAAVRAADFPAVITDPVWRPANIARPGVDELYNQGTDYLNNGNYDKAIEVFSEAIQIDPTREEIFCNRGVAKKKKGDLDGAITDYTKAIELKPGENLAYHNRALAYEAKGEYEKALLDTASEMQIAPQNPKGFNETAWIYATCPKAEFRDGAKAIKLATKACALSQWKNGNYIDTLAAAEAEAGKFDDAVMHEQMAIVTPQPTATDKNELQSHLALFQQHKPFRDINLKSVEEIMEASKTGDLAKVTALLKEYPDLINSKDGSGWTPLVWAISKNHKDIVELLLTNKADVNAKSTGGVIALHMVATWKDGKDIVALLLANNADVNASDTNGMTPLLYAASWNRKDTVELLLAKGADVNAKDNTGKTPLKWAVNEGLNDMADLLRQHGGHE